MGSTQPNTRAYVNKVVKVHPVGRMNVNLTLETLESGWKMTEEIEICFPIEVKMLKCRLYIWCIGRVIKSKSLSTGERECAQYYTLKAVYFMI